MSANRLHLHRRENSLVKTIFITLGVYCLWLLGGVTGCQTSTTTSVESAIDYNQQRIDLLLDLPTITAVQSWEMPAYIQEPTEALIFETRHYRFFSTLEDPLILRQIPVFMEAAFNTYQKFPGKMQPLESKLEIYIFGRRSQWEDFTRHLAGSSAELYLKNRSGAYYLNDVCVAYHLGRQSDFSILAHEGWHQFSDRHFTYRLPAWLDEGLATQFEAFQWNKGKVTFKPSLNGSRLAALRQGLEQNRYIGLSEMVRSDAGRMLAHSDTGSSNPQALTYYAQLYALIRFLREENYGQRYPQLRRILHHGYLGRHWPITEAQRQEALQAHQNRSWNAQVGQRLFQAYIAGDLDAIEPAYQAFCRKIVTRLTR